MGKEITLPFTSETCDKISTVLLHILLISGIPALIIGGYYWFTAHELFYALIGIGLTIYGTVFSLMFFTGYSESISDWYDEHKITFKCKCEKESIT